MSQGRQRLNVTPYSKIGKVLFLGLHGFALVFHLLSFLVGLGNIPADVLVTPLAELVRTRTEIVGPCIGNTTNTNTSGCEATVGTFVIGADSQPRCTAVEIADVISCGVYERHEDAEFYIEFSETEQQTFNTINVFRLFVLVDLLSIIFHAYAMGMVITSPYRNPFEGCKGCCSDLLKLFGQKGRPYDPDRELPEPTKAQLANPRNPRAPEYNRRWFDIALTFGILTIAVAISVGITQFFVLVHMFLGVQSLALLGFLVDDARYQLIITDSRAYNQSIYYDYLKKAIESSQFENDDECKYMKLADSYDYQFVINRYNRMKPLPVGWTQPVRNIVFQIGLIILLWWGITYTINDAAENLIIHMGDAEGALTVDAFKHMASIYQWGTGIIGFWMLLVLLGDILDGDRSVAEEPTPGNFILDELDGDACFIILMFTTKIVVTWLCVSTIYDVYNFAGGKEHRHGELSQNYLDRSIDGNVTRGLMTVLGICSIVGFGLFNWFLTPSSRVYCYVGLKIEQATGCCNKRLPANMQKKKNVVNLDPAEQEDEPGEEELYSKINNNLYF